MPADVPTVAPVVDPAAIAAANVEAVGAIGPESRSRAPSPDGGFAADPLVRFIIDDVGGILSKSAAKSKAGAERFNRYVADQYDDAPRFPDPRHNKIYDPVTGQDPANAAGAAADAGLLPPNATASDLWQALDKIGKSSHSMAKQERAQTANMRIAEKQARSFTAAIARPARGEHAINASDLQVGDRVKIGTEQMKVTDIDPDTLDVTIEDGSKFGVQHVGDNQVIYGEHTASIESRAANDFLSEFHDASVNHEQNAVPFGFGPGAAAMGENLRVGSQIHQLTATVADSLRTPRPAAATARVTKAVNAVGGKFVTARETIQRAANTARATWLALKNAYLRPAKVGDFWETVKDWQGADQRTSFEVRQFVQKLHTEMKDPLTRDAITNYIQADGDPAILRQRASASNIKYRPGYEAALTLTDAQKTLAANVRQYFDGMLQDGMNAGILDHGLDNYINQVWKRPNKFTQELQADLQAGKLQTNFQFARKRIFGSFYDGEQAGYAPASKDVSALVASYDLSFNKALAARAFVKSLREAKAADGEPVVKFSGATQPIPGGEAPPEAYLIRSRSMPEGAVAADGRAYAIVDHPALRGWKMVVQDGAETPAFFQADMLVHPDHASRLKNILGRSWLRQVPVFREALQLGALAKQTKLSLSIFHLDQEGLHGLFHRVNPANLTKIDFNDPVQWNLVRNGLQVADYHAMELFAEGLRGGGLVAKIPGLGKLQNTFNEFLFKDYIPRLKMTMALHAFERNTGRYPKLSPDVVAELTARQGNAAFGELNYKLMARNPTFQDFLRLTILAPDFLEARSKFVGQALKPYGGEQRAALILGAATMYVTARALNQWLDKDPHWNKPFSVIYNGREYRLRTVMGDVGEMFLDPRRFFYNRFSPWLKQGVSAATGRDYRGIKLTALDQVKDALSWFVPIPFGHQENASVMQRVLGGAGVSNKPAETPVDLVYKSALKFKEGLTDPKVQAEVRRAQQETYAQADYAGINRALVNNDRERAVREIVDAMKSKGKTASDLTRYYSNLPSKAFTGSQALEAEFLRGMQPAERARYQSAVNQRINLARTFFQILPLALRENRK